MKSFKKVCNFTVLAMSIVLVFSGCNLFNSTPSDLSGDSGAKIVVDESADLKELDLLILRSIYPAGLVDALAEAEELASGSNARNFFEPSSYTLAGWKITEDAEDEAGNPIYIEDADADDLIYIYIYDLDENDVHCFVYANGDPVFVTDTYSVEGTDTVDTIYYIMNGTNYEFTNRVGEDLLDAADNSLEYGGQPIDVAFAAFSIFDVHQIIRNATPEEAYQSAANITVRFPATGYLVQSNTIDPTVEGEFFTMAAVGTTAYKITFTLVKKELSSLDYVETIYYVGLDSWDSYVDSSLSAEGWASERVYYRNRKIGDRVNQDTFKGNAAKAYFSTDPDFGPFNVSTGDPGFQYTSSNNNPSDIWVQSVAGQASYSSETLTQVFPEFTSDFTGDDWESSETNYYTEANVTTYPSVIDSWNTTPATLGEVRASVIYYKKQSNIEKLQMVTAGSSYYIDDNFIMKDVKSLQEDTSTGQVTYPFVYHHKYFYNDTSNILIYTNIYRYFIENNYNQLVNNNSIEDTDLGVKDDSDKKIETILTLESDVWSGTLEIFSTEFTTEEGTSISFEVELVGSFLNYVTTVDDEETLIAPNINGVITFPLPGGGTFAGQVTESGILSGIYTPSDGGVPVYI